MTKLFQVGLCSHFSRNVHLSGLRNLYFLLSGIPNATFFFSAIGTQERKGNIQIENCDSDDENKEYDSVPSTQSDKYLDGSPTLVDKSLWPAISYWLALTTPNGAPANPIVVHRALLECGISVKASQVLQNISFRSSVKHAWFAI